MEKIKVIILNAVFSVHIKTENRLLKLQLKELNRIKELQNV